MNARTKTPKPAAKRHAPIHPGEVLEADFLEPFGITPYKLAKAIHVPGPRVYDLVRGRRGVTPDTAVRLGLYFGTSAEFWMNLQTRYDLEALRDEQAAAAALNIVPLDRSAA